MAGNTVRPATMGVGPALRRARALRGITLDDAARDTKLRVEQLRALEDEDFDAHGGDVYVRAMLRTYAQYLGLDADKVGAVYARHTDAPEPPPPPGRMGRVERAIAATRVRDNQRFLLFAAAAVLIALVSVGLVSRGGAPAPAALPTSTLPVSSTLAAGAGTTIEVTLVATQEVDVEAIVDGTPAPAARLRPGEIASYSATSELTVSVDDGGLVGLVVDGQDFGAAGVAGEPWARTWIVDASGEVAASPT